MLEQLKIAFTENIPLKLLSFAVALILYSMVHGGDAQRTLSVGVVVRLPPESANRVLVSNIPPEIRVTLHGTRSGIDDLRAEDLGDVLVDLRSGQDKRVVFDGSMVRLPAGVKVDRFDPSVLEFAWEDQIVSDVPVQVGVVGTPAPGYVVKGTTSVEPKTVRVKGPKSEVLVLQHARADAFDVTGLQEGVHEHTVALDRPTGRMQYEIGSVTAHVEIAREVAERSFTKLAVAVVGVAKGKTQPAEIDVRLVCPPDVVHSLRAEQLVPQVHVPQGAPTTGSESYPIELVVEGCELYMTPKTVVVKW
jgi:YbbR domain-containing protein